MGRGVIGSRSDARLGTYSLTLRATPFLRDCGALPPTRAIMVAIAFLRSAQMEL